MGIRSLYPPVGQKSRSGDFQVTLFRFSAYCFSMQISRLEMYSVLSRNTRRASSYFTVIYVARQIKNIAFDVEPLPFIAWIQQVDCASKNLGQISLSIQAAGTCQHQKNCQVSGHTYLLNFLFY